MKNPQEYLSKITVFVPLVIFFLTIIPTSLIFGQAPNDDCSDASEIIISNNNYGLGLFTSEIVNAGGNSAEAGTYFLDASVHDRDVWFTFYLPTARYGKLELLQTSAVNDANDFGFITYLRANSNCPPSEAWIDPAKLTPVPQQGSTDTECLDPGIYMVQVTLSPEAAGQIYLELTLGVPFENAPASQPLHDDPSDDLSILNAPLVFDVGCQTVDSDVEFECLPTANPEELNQSLWWSIQSGNFPEYISVEFSLSSNSSSNILPENIGVRLFQGNAQLAEWTTLPEIGTCRMMQPIPDTTIMYTEFKCENIEPNTTLSLAVFFPGGYANDNVTIKTCKRGGFDTSAPRPILSEMNPNSVLGVLPSSSFGITSSVLDTFTCGSSLTLPANQCGTVNPPNFVTMANNGTNYDLEYSTWVRFELGGDAEVEFSFGTDRDYRFVRLFSKDITEDCSAINATTDLIASWKEDETISCLPAGAYALQILGGNAVSENWNCGKSMLGRKIRLYINVKDQIPINEFSLVNSNAYEKINNLNPLVPGTGYTLSEDIFGCENTVQIAGGTCDDRRKIMLREFIVNQNGVLKISNIESGNPEDFHHKLYKGSIASLAAAQNAYMDDEVIMNAIEYVGGCITESANSNANYYCLSSGHYSWVTFGDEEQRGYGMTPTIRFNDYSAEFIDPNNPDDLGDLTNVDTLVTSVDTFTCGNNPLVIGGVNPCGNDIAIMQLYRVFYLSEPRRAEIISPSGNPYNLFIGDISNGVNNLIPWVGDNDANEQWNLCESWERTSDCDMLTPGFYTLVAYGTTASYDNPALQSTAGDRGDLGRAQFFQIHLEEPEEIKCNHPSKTCFANEGELADWNHDVIDELCPTETKVIYQLDTVFLNCLEDTPFSAHPIEACANDDNRVVYYGFRLSDVSFVSLINLPWDMEVKIYDFDATLNPQLLTQQEPIAPCAVIPFDRREYCSVPPGDYTIVIFGKDDHKGIRIAPKLAVERVLSSRFDHWAQAYDFGVVPPNGDTYFGKEGDLNPLNESLRPSNDYISCLTSGEPTDPMDGVCCVAYNPLVSGEPFNIQYTETQPYNSDRSLRNIIYTFVLEGSGECMVTLENCTDDANGQRPYYAIYKSDSGATPFDQLQNNGGIDSTYADGLTLVDYANKIQIPCDTFCAPPRRDTIFFNKTACEELISRYYVVVSATPTARLNQQLSLGISYVDYPFIPVQFDEFDDPGSAVSGTGVPPSFELMPGNQEGELMSFQCATANPTDPEIPNCVPEHTVWYHFTSEEVGSLHLAYENELGSNHSTTEYMKLFKASSPASVNNLEEISLADFPNTNPLNTTGRNWRKGCIDPGDYYLFWGACGDTLGVFDLYRPVIYFDPNPGDYCWNAVPIDLVGEGTASNTLTVDCHTIGTEPLDGPDGYDCLLGPEGYKSSFFILNLIGPAKRDVTFSMQENTSADFSQIRYRVLPGYCGAVTPGLCSSDPNTSFTLNCLGEGTYIIQVVTIEETQGTITFTVDATNTPDQDCVPLDPLAVKALFIYNSCEGDSIYFENQSTLGYDMVYEWTFPDYSTGETSPRYYYPRPDQAEYMTVSLLAINVVTGRRDSIEVEVEIPPIVEPIEAEEFFLCEDSTVTVTAVSYTNTAIYEWSTGEIEPSIQIVEAGQYFVTVAGTLCPRIDSIAVTEVFCDSLYLEECDSINYLGNLIYESGIFTDTIAGDPDKDTLRKVTTVVNTISDLILDPESLQIEIGDQIDINAYTSAEDPTFSWTPIDLFEEIRENKIRVQPPFSTVFNLLVEDSDGCLREASSTITVAEIYNDVYIPNAFSPNGDGINDYFFPFAADHIIQIVDFQVFNRWGAVIYRKENFEANDWQEGWDGQFKDKESGVGVYTYFAKAEYINGAVIVFKGEVTLFR